MGKQVGFHLEPMGASTQSVIRMESGRSWEAPSSKNKPGRKGRRDSAAARRTLLLATFVGALLVAGYTAFAGHTAFSVHTLAMGGMHGMRRFGDGTADTLVIYVYAHTDVEYAENLRFFLDFGVEPDDGCDYLVVAQEGRGVLSSDLPPLPDNVQAVRHPNECFDWGTFGWAIEERIVDTSRYRFVIFLNSSVRGPFMPAYWPTEMHWTHVLTSRLSDDVKLVGATISCEGANKGGVLSGEMRRNPHVQSYVVATDQTGLAVLREEGDVLKCYKSIHDAIWYAEIGSSAAILKAGFNIDALMLRYQGVDWREKANWGCNAGINPYAEYMYDGVNISPFEVMFVKVKEFLLEANWTTATSAKKYTAWMKHEDKLHENEYNAKKTELRHMKILNMRARGSACFDFDFYRLKNPDLPVWGHETMWEHFVTSGQHEGRVFRFRCKPGDVEYPQPPPSPKKSQHAAPAAAANATSTGKGAGTGTAVGTGKTSVVAAGDVITTKQAAEAQRAAAAQKAAAEAAAQQAAAEAQQAAAAAEQQQAATAATQQQQAAAAAAATQQRQAVAAGSGGAAGGAAGGTTTAAAEKQQTVFTAASVGAAAAGQAAGAVQQTTAAQTAGAGADQAAAVQATAVTADAGAAAGQVAEAAQQAGGAVQQAAAAQTVAVAGATQQAGAAQTAAAQAAGAAAGTVQSAAQQLPGATAGTVQQAAGGSQQTAAAAAAAASQAGAAAGQQQVVTTSQAGAAAAQSAAAAAGQAAGVTQQAGAAQVAAAQVATGAAAEQTAAAGAATATVQAVMQQPGATAAVVEQAAITAAAVQQAGTTAAGGLQTGAAGQSALQAAGGGGIAGALEVAGAAGTAAQQQAAAAGASQQAAAAGVAQQAAQAAAGSAQQQAAAQGAAGVQRR